MTCLVLALQWGGTVYPWSNSRVWGLLLGFGLLTILFVGLQIRGKEEYVHTFLLLPHSPLLFRCMRKLTIPIEHSSPHE